MRRRCETEGQRIARQDTQEEKLDHMLITTPYDTKLKPLIEAVDSGNLDQVRKWIEFGEPLYNPKSRSASVLDIASEQGFFSMLELLLSVGGWEQYPQALDSALQEAVRIPHVDNARLLLDHGANPNSVGWYSIFASHKRDLVTVFLEHKKDASDIDEGIEEAEWGTARAVRDWLENDRTMEAPLLRKMIELLDDIYENSTWYIGRNDDYKQREQQADAAKHAERLFSLIRWTGVDTRRSVVVDEEDGTTDSVFAAVVRKGTRNQLRSLGHEASDADLLNKAAYDMEWCDEAKADYMYKCGLVINDRQDGTSSLLLAHFKRQNEPVVMYLAEHGAKMPEVDTETLKEWQNHFYKYSKPRPGILLALAKVLTPQQMSVAIHGVRATEVFGADEATIVENLYDPDKSESPDAFVQCMEKVKASIKGAAVHPLARKYRGYCLQSDREPYSPELVRLFGRQVKMCNFRGNECSKEIRPWIVCVLNQFIPKCIEKGAKFRFEEIKDEYRYRNDRPDVDFIATIDGYDVPIVFREGKIKPKAYLLRESVSGDVYSGKLQFCHRLGRSVGSPEVVLREYKYLWFQDHIEEMVDGLFAVVKKKKKADAREKERQERLEKERQERERVAREHEEKRLAEERLRAQEERKRHEEVAAIEAQKAAEERLFNDVVLKARVAADCRRVRSYLEDVQKTIENAESEDRVKMLSWLEAVKSVLEKKERWSLDPFSEVEPVIKEPPPAQQEVDVGRLAGTEMAAQRNFWANRGWWNKR